MPLQLATLFEVLIPLVLFLILTGIRLRREPDFKEQRKWDCFDTNIIYQLGEHNTYSKYPGLYMLTQRGQFSGFLILNAIGGKPRCFATGSCSTSNLFMVPEYDKFIFRHSRLVYTCDHSPILNGESISLIVIAPVQGRLLKFFRPSPLGNLY